MTTTITITPADKPSVWVCGTEHICRFVVGIGNQEVAVIEAPSDELARDWAHSLKDVLTDWIGDCRVPDHQEAFEDRMAAACDRTLGDWLDD